MTGAEVAETLAATSVLASTEVVIEAAVVIV